MACPLGAEQDGLPVAPGGLWVTGDWKGVPPSDGCAWT